MNFENFINECKNYLEKTLGISLEKIKDINEDTLLGDDCDNFYGFYASYNNYRLSLMYYEEEIDYNYPIIMTIDEDSENICHFEYLSDVNRNNFKSNNLNEAYYLIDKVLNDIKVF